MPDESSPTHMETTKPKFRGSLHKIMFFVTCCLLFGYLILYMNGKWNNAILIYLLCQFLLFGTSTVYHGINWKTEENRKTFQKLDHASIFFLISGTQTSVTLILLPYNNISKSMLLVTWSISLLGICKVMLIDRITEMFDVVIYILHGISLLPFCGYMVKYVNKTDMTLFIFGGILYIIGATLFGLHKPELFPEVFGFHEVFHVFTVLANFCFMVPIFKGYLNNNSVAHSGYLNFIPPDGSPASVTTPDCARNAPSRTSSHLCGRRTAE